MPPAAVKLSGFKASAETPFGGGIVVDCGWGVKLGPIAGVCVTAACPGIVDSPGGV